MSGRNSQGPSLQADAGTRPETLQIPWRHVYRPKDERRAGAHRGGAEKALGSMAETGRKFLNVGERRFIYGYRVATPFNQNELVLMQHGTAPSRPAGMRATPLLKELMVDRFYSGTHRPQNEETTMLASSASLAGKADCGHSLPRAPMAAMRR